MKVHCSSVYNEIMLLVTNSDHISYWQYWIILTLKGNISCSLSFYCIFIAPERNHILKNGFQMCTRHILTISASFSAFWNNGQMRRTSGWLESWLMRPAEEEELEFHPGQARVEKSADCSHQRTSAHDHTVDLLHWARDERESDNESTAHSAVLAWERFESLWP